MVKLHGGESQQFNYTGVNNPLAQSRLGEPNNLGPDAIAFLSDLASRGHGDEDFLLYIAGIYNSQVASDYLEGGGRSIMHIPIDPRRLDSRLVDRIIETSRSLRNLHWLSAEVGEGDRI
jgi:hypothetical protein